MSVNQFVSLNKIEFVITYACTGKCKHCSEGEHSLTGEHIDAVIAADTVRAVAEKYPIETLMTFGGEPLLYPDVVCAIHSAGRDAGIPKRQIITNGFFSESEEFIKKVAENLASSGVNDILLSVDAFHRETIPLKHVRMFAEAVKKVGIPIRTQPAWLVAPRADNPYNKITEEILKDFADMGICENSGNVIFPSGNALIYLKEYFASDNVPSDPYVEDERNIMTLSIDPDGTVLGENIYSHSVLDIIEKYTPTEP